MDTIKLDLKKFNKTQALFLCAKLNLITSSGRTYEINRDKAQAAAFKLLLSDQLVGKKFLELLDEYRAQVFREKQKLAIVFTREGLLEMIRALCLWGNSDAGHQCFLKQDHAQDAFFSALLTSTDFFMKRYARFFPNDSSEEREVLEGEALEEYRRNYQPMMRVMSEFAPPTRDPLFSLGRARLLLNEEFFDKHSEYATEFRNRHENLSMEEYIASSAAILSVSIARMPQGEQIKSLSDTLQFEETKMFAASELMREPFEKYLKCKSQSVESLSNNFKESFESIDELLSLKPIRERPILLENGIGVVIDEKLFADSISVGPMFSLLKNDRTWNRKVFSDFGNACHRYAHRIIEHYFKFINVADNVEVIAEPKGVWTIESRQERSLGDTLVIEDTRAILFETKGNWFNETALRSSDSYWSEINRLYGVSIENDEEKRRGFAQLADVVKASSVGNLTALEESAKFNDAQTIFPVLLAHDELVHQINLSRFLAKLFAKEFGLDHLPECGSFSFYNKTIHSLIVLSFTDLEMMQARQIDKGMSCIFEEFSKWSPMRDGSLNEFFAVKYNGVARRPKNEQLLLQAASETLNRVALLCFGQSLPD